ncbi:MAG TPA: hypothetical protein VHK06_05550 [Candidatus Limnocylindria bacterium]|nr:hypothetical protein [Candidatus Limnocylindria bacterium]
MDNPLPDLPIGGFDGFMAKPITNSGGEDGVLVVDHHEQPQLLLATRRDDDRLDALVVGELVLVRPGDPTALAGWLGRGTGRPVAAPAAWAGWVGFGLLLLILACTVVGALTVAGWLVAALRG